MTSATTPPFTALLLLQLLACASSFSALLHPARYTNGAPTAVAPACGHSILSVVRMCAAADGGAADDAAAAEGEDPVASEVVDETTAASDKGEEEEEEDDLLSTPAFLKQKLKVLEKELADVQEKTAAATAAKSEVAGEWEQKRTRLQTDFDNFRARHVNQTLEAQLDVRIKVLNEFLPVLDNFDRARASISPEGEAQAATNALYEEMHGGLMTTLGELGMEKIDAVGSEFDYNLHMAIQQIPSDEYDEGVVCTEMQPGYTCQGKLLRAAYVAVAL